MIYLNEKTMGIYMGKFVEQEINSSVVQIMRAFRDNLNPTAYQALRMAVDVTVVRNELAQQRDLFVAWIKDPRISFDYSYVPIEVMKD